MSFSEASTVSAVIGIHKLYREMFSMAVRGALNPHDITSSETEIPERINKAMEALIAELMAEVTRRFK